MRLERVEPIPGAPTHPHPVLGVLTLPAGATLTKEAVGAKEAVAPQTILGVVMPAGILGAHLHHQAATLGALILQIGVAVVTGARVVLDRGRDLIWTSCTHFE